VAVILIQEFSEEQVLIKCVSTCTLMFIAALFTIANLWKQPRCPPTDEWIKKMWYIYTKDFYSAIRNYNMQFEGK
jgi:hypothetical protein